MPDPPRIILGRRTDFVAAPASEHGPVRIGNQTSFSAATPLEPFEYALENGFDAFEWFPDKKPGGGGWDELDLDRALRADIRQAARTADVTLSVHARWAVTPFHRAWEPILLRDIELAQDLGASLLNIHLHQEQGIMAYAQAILGPLRWAAAHGLKLAIENTPETTPDDFNALFAALDGLNPPQLAHVGMCLDLGHANLCQSTHHDYLGYLDQLEPHVPIIHLHVHENWGDADTHLPLFTGPAGRDDAGVRAFLDRICQRGYRGAVILEQWPQPPSLLNQARDRLLKMLSEEISA